MKRLFAALKIDPDPEFTGKYGELKRELRHEPIKWVEDHNIHITMKFFGETDERKIPEIKHMLGKCASETFPIELRLSGLGIFGSSYAPRVIWVGVEPISGPATLMKKIHEDLKLTGVESDRQNLVPHLTLGRIKFLKDKAIFNRTIEKFKPIASKPVRLREMVLFESLLHREGPEYIALEKFAFIKDNSPDDH